MTSSVAVLGATGVYGRDHLHAYMRLEEEPDPVRLDETRRGDHQVPSSNA